MFTPNGGPMADLDDISTALLTDIEAFLRREKMSARAFSEQASGSKDFVIRLREGKHSPRTTTVQRVRAFMAGFQAARERAK